MTNIYTGGNWCWDKLLLHVSSNISISKNQDFKEGLEYPFFQSDLQMATCSVAEPWTMSYDLWVKLLYCTPTLGIQNCWWLFPSAASAILLVPPRPPTAPTPKLTLLLGASAGGNAVIATVWALGGSSSRRSSARHSRRVWCVRAAQYSHCARSRARRSSTSGSNARAIGNWTYSSSNSVSSLTSGSTTTGSSSTPQPPSSTSTVFHCWGSGATGDVRGPDRELERLTPARRGSWFLRLYKGTIITNLSNDR